MATCVKRAKAVGSLILSHEGTEVPLQRVLPDERKMRLGINASTFKGLNMLLNMFNRSSQADVVTDFDESVHQTFDDAFEDNVQKLKLGIRCANALVEAKCLLYKVKMVPFHALGYNVKDGKVKAGLDQKVTIGHFPSTETLATKGSSMVVLPVKLVSLKSIVPPSNVKGPKQLKICYPGCLVYINAKTINLSAVKQLHRAVNTTFSSFGKSVPVTILNMLLESIHEKSPTNDFKLEDVMTDSSYDDFRNAIDAVVSFFQRNKRTILKECIYPVIPDKKDDYQSITQNVKAQPLNGTIRVLYTYPNGDFDHLFVGMDHLMSRSAVPVVPVPKEGIEDVFSTRHWLSVSGGAATIMPPMSDDVRVVTDKYLLTEMYDIHDVRRIEETLAEDETSPYEMAAFVDWPIFLEKNHKKLEEIKNWVQSSLCQIQDSSLNVARSVSEIAYMSMYNTLTQNHHVMQIASKMKDNRSFDTKNIILEVKECQKDIKRAIEVARKDSKNGRMLFSTKLNESTFSEVFEALKAKLVESQLSIYNTIGDKTDDELASMFKSSIECYKPSDNFTSETLITILKKHDVCWTNREFTSMYKLLSAKVPTRSYLLDEAFEIIEKVRNGVDRDAYRQCVTITKLQDKRDETALLLKKSKKKQQFSLKSCPTSSLLTKTSIQNLKHCQSQSDRIWKMINKKYESVRKIVGDLKTQISLKRQSIDDEDMVTECQKNIDDLKLLLDASRQTIIDDTQDMVLMHSQSGAEFDRSKPSLVLAAPMNIQLKNDKFVSGVFDPDAVCYGGLAVTVPVMLARLVFAMKDCPVFQPLVSWADSCCLSPATSSLSHLCRVDHEQVTCDGVALIQSVDEYILKGLETVSLRHYVNDDTMSTPDVAKFSGRNQVIVSSVSLDKHATLELSEFCKLSLKEKRVDTAAAGAGTDGSGAFADMSDCDAYPLGWYLDETRSGLTTSEYLKDVKLPCFPKLLAKDWQDNDVALATLRALTVAMSVIRTTYSPHASISVKLDNHGKLLAVAPCNFLEDRVSLHMDLNLNRAVYMSDKTLYETPIRNVLCYKFEDQSEARHSAILASAMAALGDGTMDKKYPAPRMDGSIPSNIKFYPKLLSSCDRPVHSNLGMPFAALDHTLAKAISGPDATNYIAAFENLESFKNVDKDTALMFGYCKRRRVAPKPCSAMSDDDDDDDDEDE